MLGIALRGLRPPAWRAPTAFPVWGAPASLIVLARGLTPLRYAADTTIAPPPPAKPTMTTLLSTMVELMKQQHQSQLDSQKLQHCVLSRDQQVSQHQQVYKLQQQFQDLSEKMIKALQEQAQEREEERQGREQRDWRQYQWRQQRHRYQDLLACSFVGVAMTTAAITLVNGAELLAKKITGEVEGAARVADLWSKKAAAGREAVTSFFASSRADEGQAVPVAKPTVDAENKGLAKPIVDANAKTAAGSAAKPIRYHKNDEINNIVRTFKAARLPLPQCTVGYVERPQLEATLQRLIQADGGQLDKYILITGDRGVGKSAAVKKAVNVARQQGHGILYLSVDSANPFDEQLTATLQGKVPWSVPDCVKDNTAESMEFRQLVSDLKAAAAAHFEKHKIPLVLIIDGAEKLTYDQYFLPLRELAHDGAVAGNLRIIVVSNSADTVTRLLSAVETKSRLLVVEVDELSDNEAVTYLTTRDVDRSQAQHVVDSLTGGHLLLLQEYVHLRGHKTLQQQLHTKFGMLDAALAACGLDARANLFAALVKDGRVLTTDAKRCVTPHQFEALCRAGILTVQENGVSCAFSFRYVHTFFHTALHSASWWWLGGGKRGGWGW